MRAEIENGSVVIEDVLGAVAVVIIPVHDQHAPDTMLHLQIPGRDGDVVEDAETHAAIGRSVMARRPDGCESIPDLSGHHRVHNI